jgi:protein AATF/BFR2
MDRLIKRSQLKRSDNKIFGLADAPSPASNADPTSNHFEFIYDDNDFYQEMLKELVESRIADSGNFFYLIVQDPALLGMKWSSIKLSRKKKKKVVDTRASKGRKIRYDPHEKLENFMAPVPVSNWHDEMSEELFGSLFGFSMNASTIVPDVGASDGFEIFKE